MRSYKLSECEVKELPQGKIFLGHSSKEVSFGYLELNPNQSLNKHNRPADEELIQIKGESVMTLFPEEEKITLKEGDYIKIPANKFHIHGNESSSKCLTLWKFEGDITEIINAIKKQ